MTENYRTLCVLYGLSFRQNFMRSKKFSSWETSIAEESKVYLGRKDSAIEKSFQNFENPF